MAGREQFLLRLLDRLGGVCRRAGGRSVGWSGGAAGLGYLLASVPPRLGRHSVGSVGWAAGPVLALALRSGGCHESLETQAETSGETGGKLECFLVAAWRRLDYHSLPLTTVTRKLDGGVWSCLDLGPLLSLHYSPHRYM